MKKIYLLIAVCCSLLTTLQVSAQFISFDKLEYNFGIISPNHSNTANFSITNRGDEPVIITNVSSTNPNISFSITRDTLAKGAHSSLSVTLNPENLSSVFQEKIVVSTTDKVLKDIILTLKGTVKEISPEIEKKYPGVFDVVRVSKMNIYYGKINYPETAVDTIYVYNPQDTAVTLIFPNIPDYMTVQMFPERIQPNSSAMMLVSYNSGIRKEWGDIYDRLYLGFQGKKVNYKMKFSISGSITQDFSKMTKKQLKNAPKIKFETDTIGFGTVKQGDPVAVKFNFKNEGKSTLEILKIKTSCGCTAGTMDKLSYGKGESGVVNVTLNTRNKRNHVRQTITIISNDPKDSEHKVYIDGEVEVKE